METSTFVFESKSEPELGLVAPDFVPVKEVDAAIKSGEEQNGKKSFLDKISETLDTINEGADTVLSIVDPSKNTVTTQPPQPQKSPGSSALKVVGMTAAGVVGLVLMVKLITPNRKS